MIKQAIIYCRFSPRPDADACKSNEGQSLRCQRYCESKGMYQNPEFYDRGVSGKTSDRPGLNAAIKVLKPGMILVVDTRDRLARDMLVSLTIHQRVKEKGATIEIADGSPSRETPEGNLMANILDAFAQYERERFARRTKAGLAKKKKNGDWLGKPPIGWEYNKKTKKLIKCPEEQWAIESVLFWHKAHDIGSEMIAGRLNWKYPNGCRGKPWSARTVRKIIAREKKST